MGGGGDVLPEKLVEELAEEGVRGGRRAGALPWGGGAVGCAKHWCSQVQPSTFATRSSYPTAPGCTWLRLVWLHRYLHLCTSVPLHLRTSAHLHLCTAAPLHRCTSTWLHLAPQLRLRLAASGLISPRLAAPGMGCHLRLIEHSPLHLPLILLSSLTFRCGVGRQQSPPHLCGGGTSLLRRRRCARGTVLREPCRASLLRRRRCVCGTVLRGPRPV